MEGFIRKSRETNAPGERVLNLAVFRKDQDLTPRGKEAVTKRVIYLFIILIILLPLSAFARIQLAPRKVTLKPDLVVREIRIEKNRATSKLVTDVPFDVWVYVEDVGPIPFTGSVEVRLRLSSGYGVSPIYERTISISIPRDTGKYRVHFSRIVIHSSDISFSGRSAALRVSAKIDPSNRVEEVSELNNVKSMPIHIYKMRRDLTLRRAYVEGLRDGMLTLNRYRTVSVRFVIENTGNVKFTGNVTLFASLRGDGRVYYEEHSSPAVSLMPGESTEAFLVIRNVNPRIVSSEGIEQLAPYTLKAVIVLNTASGRSAIIVPPHHTFTSEPFYVEFAEGRLFVKAIEVERFQTTGSGITFEGEALVTGTGDGAWRAHRRLPVFLKIYHRGRVVATQRVGDIPLIKDLPVARLPVTLRVFFSDEMKRLFNHHALSAVGIAVDLDEQNGGEVVFNLEGVRWHPTRPGTTFEDRDHCLRLSLPSSDLGNAFDFQIYANPDCLRGKHYSYGRGNVHHLPLLDCIIVPPDDAPEDVTFFRDCYYYTEGGISYTCHADLSRYDWRMVKFHVVTITDDGIPNAFFVFLRRVRRFGRGEFRRRQNVTGPTLPPLRVPTPRN